MFVVCLNVHVCIYNVSMCICRPMYVYLYVCMYICMYVCMYVFKALFGPCLDCTEKKLMPTHSCQKFQQTVLKL